MSFEDPRSEGPTLSEIDKRQSEYKARLASQAEREPALKERLAKVVALSYEEEWIKDWMHDALSIEGAEERMENFFENVSRSETLQKTLREDPGLFRMLFYKFGESVFEDPEDTEVTIHNIKEREQEITRNQRDRRARILANPYASDEEYRLGTYRESLEWQVRDAVFELQRKGYLPFESGFDNLTEGSQYIGLSIENDIDIQEIISILKQRKIPFQIYKNRVQILLYPKNKKLPPEDWKILWDKVASFFPDKKDLSSYKNINNGTQGEEFRNAQDKIKAGQNAWLRDGLAFIGGKVVKMDYQDFKG